MMKFLLKGLLRDRSRSVFPVLTVFAGVMLTVLLYSWLQGVVSGLIQSTAHYSTGHVRVMSRAYAAEADQIPNDLGLIGVDTLLTGLRKDFPEFLWTPRIKFGGLLDIPDENGETRSQGPVSGTAVSLLSSLRFAQGQASSPEWKILNIKNAIVRGRAPQNPGEILIADEFAKKLKVQMGQTATLISSTMYGSMSTTNFIVVGTIRFGVAAMDRGAMIADISDVQRALDMEDAAGEIMGFSPDDIYHNDRAQAVTTAFNAKYNHSEDEFAPVMGTLRNESGLADYLDMVGAYSGVIIGIFVLVMSLVLWNAGLIGSLRRYGEIGVRLAIGEETGHIYRSMLGESLIIGLVGSALGTLAGVGFAYYLQVKGIDISSMMKNMTLMMSSVIRARVTPMSFIIGFIPGLLATFLGTAISGIGIYKRQTSQLFKELET
ncbi:FtsX-like permease family protein [Candidatus Poribacteria bacterium]|nr:FtsX-like permease family protein [Candidatus Poribacteria bacterium]